MTAVANGPEHYDYSLLSESQFEELCYLIVAADYPEAQRLRAPDGGLDALLREAGEVVRGWQAKRFTGHIRWGQCTDSLDAAVTTYAPKRVTFCFARDLTHKQEQTFQAKLANRHAGITVDFWSAGRLTEGILRAPNGRQMVQRYFRSPPTHEEMLRTLRAAGPVDSVGVAGDRLGALRTTLGDGDPKFEYAISAGPGVADDRPLATNPRTAMSMGGVGEDGPYRVDALWRSAGSFGVQVHCEGEEAKRTVEALIRFGGEAHFEEGVSLRLVDGPQAFSKEIERQQGAVTLRMRPNPKPWNAMLVSPRSSGGPARFPIDLRPMDQPPSGFQGALTGARAGLSLLIGFSWTLPDGPGSMGMKWAFSLGGHSVQEQRSALDLLRAMAESGHIEVHDRTGERPPAIVRDFSMPPDDLEFLEGLNAFLTDLSLIEEWALYPILLPESVGEADAAAVQQTAISIREEAAWVTVGDWTVTGDDGELQRVVQDPPPEMAVALPYRVTLFGSEIDLGSIVLRPPACRILRQEPVEGRPGQVSLELRPIDSASVRAVLKRPESARDDSRGGAEGLLPAR